MNPDAILTALLNAAWQGTLLCILALAAVHVLRASAATSHAIWTVVLAICFVLPVADYAFSNERAASAPGFVAPVPASNEALRVSVDRAIAVEAPATVDVAVAANPSQAPLFAVGGLRFLSTNAILVLWALVVISALRLVRVGFAIVSTLRARTAVVSISPALLAAILPPRPGGGRSRPCRFASSSAIASPCVLGLAPPIVVLPLSFLSRPAHELRAIVLHELAHVRRYDDVRGAIEQILAAIGCWLPGVHMAVRKLHLYQERICDDAAVAELGDRRGYARMLAEMTSGAGIDRILAPCLTMGRSRVFLRVRALLEAPLHATEANRRTVATTAVAAIALASALLRVQVPALAGPGATHAGATPYTGSWALSRCSRDGALRLDLLYEQTHEAGSEKWLETRCMSDSELQGLSARAVPTSGVKTFDVVRDAGVLHAIGTFTPRGGSGKWTFRPSARFVSRLRRLGSGSPTLNQQFALMMEDFRIRTLEMLRRDGYRAPTVAELTRSSLVSDDPKTLVAASHLSSADKQLASNLDGQNALLAARLNAESKLLTSRLAAQNAALAAQNEALERQLRRVNP